MNLPVQVLDSDGKVLADSRISFISPQVDTTTQTVLVKARIANRNDALRQSQFIRARVVWGTHQNPQVPVLAVSRLADSTSLSSPSRRMADRTWPSRSR